MKDLPPNQKTLLDYIDNQSLKAPRFLNLKVPANGEAFMIIQSIYESITTLALPEFLTDSVIELVYWEIECELRKIKDKMTYLKVAEYINKKLDDYLKLAVELECFESATNIRKFLYPNVN